MWCLIIRTPGKIVTEVVGPFNSQNATAQWATEAGLMMGLCLIIQMTIPFPSEVYGPKVSE